MFVYLRGALGLAKTDPRWTAIEESALRLVHTGEERRFLERLEEDVARRVVHLSPKPKIAFRHGRWYCGSFAGANPHSAYRTWSAFQPRWVQ